MAIKFKTNFNPQAILDEIEKAKRISEDGRLSFAVTDGYFNSQAALLSMLDFPDGVKSELDIHQLISSAINKTAIAGKVTKDSYLKKINELAVTQKSKTEGVFFLLSSISIDYDSLPFKKVKIDDCEINFVTDFNKKFTSRNSIKVGKYGSGDDSGYSKVIVKMKSKNIKNAFSKAIKSLDFLRSIFCFFANNQSEIIGDPYIPINKIMFGPLHTLHHTDGSLATKEFWFEMNYLKINLYQSKAIDIYTKNVKFFIKKANKVKYKELIKNSMISYVRAFDSQDQSDALFKVWGALEKIITPKSGNDYGKIVSRCAFLYTEYYYHRELLEHLRVRRNEYVHVGEKADDSKKCCYQVQEYFRTSILFHIKNKFFFDSIDQANEFLDLPVKIETLNKKRSLYAKAIKFRNI